MAAAGTSVERHPVDKEASDTELALEMAIGAGGVAVVVLGAMGGARLDHELANLLLLADASLAGRDVRAVRGGTRVRAVHAGERLDLDGSTGELVTLLPVGGDAVGVTTEGLRWPLDGATLRMGRSRGLSNEVVAAPASVRITNGTLLVVETASGGETRMTTTDPPNAWRMVDVVVAAAVAVAFGIVFLAWNALYAATVPIFAFLPPAQAIMYGVWLLPGVLVGLIVRRPGAAVFGGLVSAAVSVLLGSPYGVDALISGAIQGAGAELGFALGLYRRWTLPIAILGGRAGRRLRRRARHPALLPGDRRRLLDRVRAGNHRQRSPRRRHRRLAAGPGPRRHRRAPRLRGGARTARGLTRRPPTMRRCGRWRARRGSRLEAGAFGIPGAATGRCAAWI